jgi:hypothetical protein
MTPKMQKTLEGKARRKTPEADLQCAVVQELALRKAPASRFWFCPNGGNLSKAQATKFKKMGLTPGVPDLHFAWFHVQNNQPMFGVIELKAGRGKTSEDQNEFLTDMAIIGHLYAVCNRADDVMQTLRRWGYPLR